MIGLSRDQWQAYCLAWGQGLSDDQIADAITEVSDPDDTWCAKRARSLRYALGHHRKSTQPAKRGTGNRPLQHQLMPSQTRDISKMLAFKPAPIERDKLPRRFPL